MDFSPNPHGLGEWLRGADDLRDACRDAAEDIAGIARTIAPRDSGTYADSIEVVDDDDVDRVGATVQATAAHSAAVEFGNTATRGRGQNVLARAAEISGLDVG